MARPPTPFTSTGMPSRRLIERSPLPRYQRCGPRPLGVSVFTGVSPQRRTISGTTSQSSQSTTVMPERPVSMPRLAPPKRGSMRSTALAESFRDGQRIKGLLPSSPPQGRTARPARQASIAVKANAPDIRALKAAAKLGPAPSPNHPSVRTD